MRSILTLVLLLCTGWLQAQPPAGYYNSAAGLTGDSLRLALHQIIDNHSGVSYASLWTHFQTTDKKANGTVWDMYSDIPGGTPPYTYTFVTDQCGNYNSEADCYNREHSFPKSWFGDVFPMNTDMFHLYPTDGYVNGMRSDHPFGEVSSPTFTSMNGSKVGQNVFPGYTGIAFEPIDEYKGDFARSYFYMVTRYMDVTAGWSSPMLSGNDLSSWAVNMLLLWHQSDTVSQKEIDRNNQVFGIQQNRNPYIDDPQFAILVWDPPAPSAINEFASSIKVGQDGRNLYISTPCPLQVLVLDVTGRIIQEQNINHTGNLQTQSAGGIYFLLFKLEDQIVLMKKIIIP